MQRVPQCSTVFHSLNWSIVSLQISLLMRHIQHPVFLSHQPRLLLMDRGLEFCVCTWLQANPVGFWNLLSSVHVFKADVFWSKRVSFLWLIGNCTGYDAQLIPYYLLSVLNPTLNDSCLCSVDGSIWPEDCNGDM